MFLHSTKISQYNNSFSIRKGIDIGYVKQLTEKLIVKYRQIPQPPISLDKILQGEKINVAFQSLDEQQLIFSKNNGNTLIVTNNRQSLSQLGGWEDTWINYAIAHMIGHKFLNLPPCDAFSIEDVLEASDNKDEQMINAFASYLLVPDFILEKWSDPVYRSLRLNPAAISSAYLFPLEALSNRRSLLSKDKQFLIFTTNERISYAEDYYKDANKLGINTNSSH